MWLKVPTSTALIIATTVLTETVATGATCGDIEAVDVARGDWTKFRPVVGAWENFAKVYPGEFLTAHDPKILDDDKEGSNCGGETVAWIENKATRTQALVFRNDYLKQVCAFLRVSYPHCFGCVGFGCVVISWALSCMVITFRRFVFASLCNTAHCFLFPKILFGTTTLRGYEDVYFHQPLSYSQEKQHIADF